MKKVLITGAKGYIGGYLENALKERFLTMPTDIPCDLLLKSNVHNILNRYFPDVIVHCAGTKDLFSCEKDPQTAYRINVETTKNLADAIDGVEVKFVFLSSDYVFSGDKGMYREEDIPSPKTVYGKTKLVCEKYIQNLSNYTICRTANVYGEGNKFFSFILDSLKDGKAVDVYNDSFFSPTYIGDLAEMVSVIITKDISGLLHTAGPDRISRYDFAKRIAKYFGLDAGLIHPVHRPKDSPIANDTSLDVNISMEKLGMRFMGIDEGLKQMGGTKCIL